MLQMLADGIWGVIKRGACTRGRTHEDTMAIYSDWQSRSGDRTGIVGRSKGARNVVTALAGSLGKSVRNAFFATAFLFVLFTGYVNAQTISSGSDHTCAVISGGVKCWGINNFGQLGDGTTTNRLTPVDAIPASSGVVSVSAGAAHTCALSSSGAVQCWGSNGFGELGTGDQIQRNSPTASIALGSGVTSIGGGYLFTCAVINGGVKCLGRNTWGTLGNGTTNSNANLVAQTAIAAGSGATSVAGFTAHACGVVSGGLRCWGDNTAGQIGDGSTANRFAPVQIFAAGSGVSAVASGLGNSTCAVVNGGVQCWGDNSNGRLGDGTLANRSLPVQAIAAGSGATAVALGANGHTCALISGGVRCWGLNDYGELGNGSSVPSLVPVTAIANGSGVNAIATGGSHSCAASTTEVRCWGYNGVGEIGNGTTSNSFFPTLVSLANNNPPAVTLTGLAINGPIVLNSATSYAGCYSGSASFSNGTSSVVSFTTFSSTSSALTLGLGGPCTSFFVSTKAVSVDTLATVTASYTYGGITKTTSLQITVKAGVAQLTSVSINGPASINAKDTATYQVTANYSDSSGKLITPTWTQSINLLTPSSTTIGGLPATNFTAASVNVDTTLTLTAAYTDGGVTKSASLPVTVKYMAAKPISILISGPTTLGELQTANYTATVTYSDGSSRIVTPSWSCGTPATIDGTGKLTTGTVSANTTFQVIANYTEGIVSVQNRLDVLLNKTLARPTKLVVSSTTQNLNEGNTAQLTAVATYSDGTSKTVSPIWAINTNGYTYITNPTIDQNGVLNPGKSNTDSAITVKGIYTDAGVAVTDQTTINIKKTVLQGQTLSINFGSARTLPIGANFTIAATASSGLAVTFKSLTSSTCAVAGSTVTVLGAGICRIEATQAGNSTYSAISGTGDILITVGANDLPPATPTGFSARIVGAGSAVLAWNTSIDPEGEAIAYRVQTSLDQSNWGGDQTTRDGGMSMSTASFSGKTVFLRVRAEDSKNNFSNWATTQLSVSGDTQLAAPQISVLPNPAPVGSKVKVTFPSVAGATGYKLYYGTSPGVYSVNFPVSSPFEFDMLAGLNLYVVVKASNGNVDSAASNEVHLTSASSAAPHIYLGTDSNFYKGGDVFSLWFSSSNSNTTSATQTYDIKIAIKLPDDTVWFDNGSGTLTKNDSYYLQGTTVFDLNDWRQLNGLSYRLSTSSQTGRYVFSAGIFQNGNFVSQSSTSFNVSPTASSITTNFHEPDLLTKDAPSEAKEITAESGTPQNDLVRDIPNVNYSPSSQQSPEMTFFERFGSVAKGGYNFYQKAAPVYDAYAKLSDVSGFVSDTLVDYAGWQNDLPDYADDLLAAKVILKLFSLVDPLQIDSDQINKNLMDGIKDYFQAVDMHKRDLLSYSQGVTQITLNVDDQCWFWYCKSNVKMDVYLTPLSVCSYDPNSPDTFNISTCQKITFSSKTVGNELKKGKIGAIDSRGSGAKNVVMQQVDQIVGGNLGLYILELRVLDSSGNPTDKVHRSTILLTQESQKVVVKIDRTIE